MNWLVEKFRRRAQERATREDAPYPMHGRTLGFAGTRQEPITVFVCNNDHAGLGDPWNKPDRGCAQCDLGTWSGGDEFEGWTVATQERADEAMVEMIGPETMTPERFADLWERSRP